jgi:hypothetical protein
MTMKNIEDELRQIACESTINHAAKVYAAELNASVDYGGFMTMGSDETVCTPDEKIASPRERLEWTKWRWLKWACSPCDITLAGCIRFLIEGNGSKDPEDSVTVEEVLAVLKGSQA